LRQMF